MARLGRLRPRHLVFGLGMVVLAVGVSLSLWMLLAPRTAGPPPEAPPLAEALQQALGLSPEAAGSLAERLQQAVGPARAAAPTGGETSLAQALQQALGLTQEQAETLAGQLQEAVGKAWATPTAGSAPGGAQDQAKVEDSVGFEVRDASGRVKQKGGSGR